MDARNFLHMGLLSFSGKHCTRKIKIMEEMGIGGLMRQDVLEGKGMYLSCIYEHATFLRHRPGKGGPRQHTHSTLLFSLNELLMKI